MPRKAGPSNMCPDSRRDTPEGYAAISRILDGDRASVRELKQGRGRARAVQGRALAAPRDAFRGACPAHHRHIELRLGARPKPQGAYAAACSMAARSDAPKHRKQGEQVNVAFKDPRKRAYLSADGKDRPLKSPVSPAVIDSRAALSPGPSAPAASAARLRGGPALRSRQYPLCPRRREHAALDAAQCLSLCPDLRRRAGDPVRVQRLRASLPRSAGHRRDQALRLLDLHGRGGERRAPGQGLERRDRRAPAPAWRRQQADRHRQDRAAGAEGAGSRPAISMSRARS